MFLNNKNEIIDWFLLNTKMFRNIEDFHKDLYFTIENNQLIINSNGYLYLDIKNTKIKELPIQFGTINGSFNLYNSKLESFKGFPTIIKGEMECPGNNFKSIKDWNIKEVYGSINLCGENCELDNLDFLENTKFKSFILIITNTPFKDNIISPLLIKHNDRLMYNDFKDYIIEYNKQLDELNNYLESFDIELDKEIK